MSIRYRAADGTETICAGLTPGGDIEAGAVAQRRGSVTTPEIAAGGSYTATITFSEPMPDSDYDVIINKSRLCNAGVPYNKTINGFDLVVGNQSSSALSCNINYVAIKTYTVQHAEQTAADIADIKAMIPSSASSTNKFSTADDLRTETRALDRRLDDVEDVIPADASITNQLATKAEIDNIYTKTEVDTKLDGKQDKLTFDNAPTAGSANPVTSAGIKTAIDAIDNTTTVNKLNACYYNVRFTGTSDIEADLVTLLNTFKTKENGTYYGDFVRISKNAGTYNLSKYSDATNTFIIGIATSGSQTWSIGVLNNNTPSVLKIVYATTPTVSAIAPFRIIKNNRCAEVSTMDGSSISDSPLTAYTWKTNVRALGTLDSKMDSSIYVMAPTVYQSGNNFYNGVARVFYSGRVDFWCTESISGSYIPYLNVTLPITE